MKSPAHFVLILSAVAFAASAAAEPTPPAKPKSSANAAPTLLTIDFPGGSIAKFISMIADSPGQSFNLIGEKSDMETLLPPVSVRNVDSPGLANALNTLLVPHGLSLIRSGETVYTLLRNDPNINQLTAFASFQIAPYLQDQSVDDITAAIRLAWQLNPSHDEKALALKYHPPTTLLLVSGSAAAVYVAERVIGSLKPLAKKTPTSEPGAPPASPPPPK